MMNHLNMICARQAEAHQKILNQEKKKGQPWIYILEINRLRKQLLLQSYYMWDRRIIYAATLANFGKGVVQFLRKRRDPLMKIRLWIQNPIKAPFLEAEFVATFPNLMHVKNTYMYIMKKRARIYCPVEC